MKYSRLVIYFLLTARTVKAELLHSNCYISLKPFAESVFILEQGTRVECGTDMNGWCQVMTKVFIRKKYVYDGIRIKSGARLLNAKGKLAGTVITEMNPYRTIDENDTCYIMEIGGYAQTLCFDAESAPERMIEKTLLKNDYHLSIDSFRKISEAYLFNDWIAFDSCQTFLLPETDMNIAKPGLRLVMVFDKNELVAIFYKRNLLLQKYESNVSMSRYNIYYLPNLKETLKRNIAQKLIPHIEILY
jgi:hypothetical protein